MENGRRRNREVLPHLRLISKFAALVLVVGCTVAIEQSPSAPMGSAGEAASSEPTARLTTATPAGLLPTSSPAASTVPATPIASPVPDPLATPGSPTLPLDLNAIQWRTATEPFAGGLEQTIQGFFLSPRGELVAWGRDQEMINSDWGDATTSFWMEGSDGSWRKSRIAELGTSSEARAVADNGEMFVAVGDAAYPITAWWSDDGESWSEAEILPEWNREISAMTSVAAGAEGFLAVGQTAGRPTAWFSPDGLHWNQTGRTFAPGSFNDVTALPNGGFVVVGVDRSHRDWDGSVWVVSPDGREWQAADPSNAIASREFDDDLVWVFNYGGGLLALGEHGNERLTCDDGAFAIAGPMVAHGPCWFYDLYAYKSTDGIHWRRFELDKGSEGNPALREFRAIAPWHGQLLAVGADTDWVVRIWVSDDGVDWMPLGEPVLINGVASGEYQADTVDGIFVSEARLIIGGSLETADGYVMIGETR